MTWKYCNCVTTQLNLVMIPVINIYLCIVLVLFFIRYCTASSASSFSWLSFSWFFSLKYSSRCKVVSALQYCLFIENMHENNNNKDLFKRWSFFFFSLVAYVCDFCFNSGFRRDTIHIASDTGESTAFSQNNALSISSPSCDGKNTFYNLSYRSSTEAFTLNFGLVN